MKVCFHHFWPGFVEGTNPNSVGFFIELFQKVFDCEIQISHDWTEADILCENACSLESSWIDKKNWRHSIAVTGESVVSFGVFSDHYHRFSCFLSGLEPSIPLKRVKFPLFLSYVFCNKNKSFEPVSSVPSNMVCAVITNPKGRVRNRFLDRLEQHMPVSYGGSFRNNIGPIGGDHNSDELIHYMKSFKFVVTMENNEEPYYITEKIVNGLFAGTIPVYWGSPRIHEYIHEDRILHLKGDTEESFLQIDRVIQQMIHMTDEDYMKRVQSPIFIKDTMTELIQDMKQLLQCK
uniref:Fucosyltransferase C-terminal domain-containing protein n=1 Tax=viral metagenome TaxID=1070528 RepID=A0A6C0KLD3_9ZZZZ